jgi:hypothetical protein
MSPSPSWVSSRAPMPSTSRLNQIDRFIRLLMACFILSPATVGECEQRVDAGTNEIEVA